MGERPITDQGLRKGDRIRVTRKSVAGGSAHHWEGEVIAADPACGFLLDGHRVHDGQPERSWFGTAESLREWARCEQTLTLLARP